MAVKKGGLGRGLDALFADNATSEESSASFLPINELEPNRNQPRKIFDQTGLEELAESIRVHGVLQPILVRPLANGQFQIVAGERRWRASRMAGLSKVPVLVKELSDEETMAIALIENLQRKDLNPIEEALGYRQLMEQFSMTQEQASQKVGKSRSAIANSLRLLQLPDAVIGMLERGELSVGHGKVLLGAKPEHQLTLAVTAAEKKWSVRELEQALRALEKPTKPAKETSFGTSPYLAQLEAALKEQMGRKVKIVANKQGKGRLEVEFYSQEDLKALATLLEQFNQ